MDITMLIQKMEAVQQMLKGRPPYDSEVVQLSGGDIALAINGLYLLGAVRSAVK